MKCLTHTIKIAICLLAIASHSVYASDTKVKEFDTNSDGIYDVKIDYKNGVRIQDFIDDRKLPSQEMHYYVWENPNSLQREIVFYDDGNEYEKSVTFFEPAIKEEDGSYKQHVAKMVMFFKDGTKQEYAPAGLISHNIKNYQIVKGDLRVERNGQEIVESYSQYDKYNRINLSKTDSNLDGQWDRIREYENGYLIDFKEDVNLDGIWDYNGMEDHKRYQSDLAKNNLKAK